MRATRSAHAGRGRGLPEEALADDLLIDGRLADVALPLAPVLRERATAAVDVLARVDARLDGALPVGHLGRRGLGEHAVELDVLGDDGAARLGAGQREGARG